MAIALGMGLLLDGCTRAPDAPSLIGRYRQLPITARDGPPYRQMVGVWETEYRADGHVLVHTLGGLSIESLYRLDGDILTITDVSGNFACRRLGVDAGSARYRVHYIDSGIRLDALRDECAGRRLGITVHAWVRIH